MIHFSKDDGVTWKTLSDLGLILQPGHEHPFIPDVINSSVMIGGADGAIDFGGRLGPRPLNLPLCFPYETTVGQMQKRGRELTVYLSDGRGRPLTLWMRFEYEFDKYYSVRYNGAVIPSRRFEVSEFVLPMIAHDPFAYQTNLSTAITWDSDVLMDNEYLTFDDKFSFILSAPATLEVNNFGRVDEWPIIQIVGSFTTLSITVGTRTLVYNEALASGTLMIDCKKMTAKLGVTNKNNKVSGNWIQLLRGLNSMIIAGTGINCTVSFAFRAKYA